ncbi:hypothetical protein K8R47_04040 [archaeon]|nr:hypothetical protein [archaeon]
MKRLVLILLILVVFITGCMNKPNHLPDINTLDKMGDVEKFIEQNYDLFLSCGNHEIEKEDEMWLITCRKPGWLEYYHVDRFGRAKLVNVT